MNTILKKSREQTILFFVLRHSITGDKWVDKDEVKDVLGTFVRENGGTPVFT